MEKWLVVLFLFINKGHWVEGTQVSRERFVDYISVSVCKDVLPNCNLYIITICSDNQYYQWAIMNCARYCNLCHTDGGRTGTRHARLDMFQGISGCFYKNQIYQEGASWNDGCNYSCRCLDGKSGLYHCKRTICTAVKTAELSGGNPGSEKKPLHNILAR